MERTPLTSVYGDVEAGSSNTSTSTSSSLPLLLEPRDGRPRLSTSTAAAAEDALSEIPLNIHPPSPGVKSSCGWSWGIPAKGPNNKGGFIPFSLPKRKRLKGPLRAARLCLLSILLPALLLTLPLYVRYRVYGRGEAFPLAASDMRLIDSHVSTTWCQRQLVEANASFNAFLMPDTPEVEDEPQRVTMHRSLFLDDDMKEYWGFYLLKGSSVSISACARWPGASLIVIKGHRHLRECAYIGEKSSEESDEMMVVDEEAEINQNREENNQNKEGNRGHTRQVVHRENITWRSPRVDGKKIFRRPPKLNLQEKKNDRNVSVDIITTTARPQDSSAELYDDILQRILQLGDRGQRVLERLNSKLLAEEMVERIGIDDVKETKLPDVKPEELDKNVENVKKIIEQIVRKVYERGAFSQKMETSTAVGNKNSDMVEIQIGNDESAIENNTALTQLNNAEDNAGKRNSTNSSAVGSNRTELKESDIAVHNNTKDNGGNAIDEEAEGLLRRVRRAILQDVLSPTEDEEQNVEEEKEVWEGLEEGHLPKPDGIADDRGTFNHWDPNDRSRSEFWSSFSSSEEALLVCDGLVLYMPLTPHLSCNENEGFGKSHHKVGEQVTKKEGLHGVTETTNAGAEDRDNTLSYQVPANGYYFFVFNSENEVQTNFLHIHFDLRRRVYRVKNPLAMCHNATHCELPLSFFSDQKVVLEVPIKQGDTNVSDPILINGELAEKNQTWDENTLKTTKKGTNQNSTPEPAINEKRAKRDNGIEGGEQLLWDESYVVVTTCEPRTTLYLCFIISVPLLILLFAFQ